MVIRAQRLPVPVQDREGRNLSRKGSPVVAEPGDAVEEQVLAVERADAGGKAVWRVKVLTASGDVRVILLDAATGRPV